MSETSTAPDYLVWNPTLSVITQALCVYAIVVGSKANLKRWIAVSSLTPLTLPEENKDEAAKAVEPRRPGWHNIFNKETGAKVFAFLLASTPSIFVWFILPRIKNQIAQNVIWAGFIFCIFSALNHVPLGMILPGETTMQYKPMAKKRGYLLQSQTKGIKYVHSIASCALTAGGLVSVYYGYTAWLPLATATWVLSMAATTCGPRLTMKHMVLILNGYILSIPILVGIIMVVVDLFTKATGSDNKASTGKDDAVLPSGWVLKVMTVFPSAMPCILVGLMLSLAIRYDYSRSAPLALPAAEGEAVPVPRKIANFSSPTFNGGIAGLVTALAGMTVVAMHLPAGMPMGTEAAGALLTIPAATIGMLVSAWRRGEVGAWWKYEERWVPKVEKDIQAKDDVEAAPASDEEKAPMLSSVQA